MKPLWWLSSTLKRKVVMRMVEQDEWIEADRLGSFASGTVTLVRNRRYRALLSVATQRPAGRMVLVNGLEAWIETPSGKYAEASLCVREGEI